MKSAIVALLVLVVLGCLGGCPSAPPAAPPSAMTPPPSSPPPAKTGAALGEQLAKTGVGESGQHVAFTGGSDRFKSKPGGCLGCHNEDGRGRTLPKGKIPAITYSALRGGAKPLYPSDDAVIAAIRDGKDQKGEALAPTMPHWTLTDAEAKALVEYLKVLDKAPPAPAAEPGAKPAGKPAAKPAATPAAKPAEQATPAKQ